LREKVIVMASAPAKNDFANRRICPLHFFREVFFVTFFVLVESGTLSFFRLLQRLHYSLDKSGFFVLTTLKTTVGFRLIDTDIDFRPIDTDTDLSRNSWTPKNEANFFR
jgi:hypothetical protein